jgi:hypothetical protein
VLAAETLVALLDKNKETMRNCAEEMQAVIQWKGLSDLLKRFTPMDLQSNADLDWFMGTEIASKCKSTLVELIRRARDVFPAECTEEVLQEYLQYMYPGEEEVAIEAIKLMCMMLPTRKAAQIHKWFHLLLKILQMYEWSSEVCPVILELYFNAAKASHIPENEPFHLNLDWKQATLVFCYQLAQKNRIRKHVQSGYFLAGIFAYRIDFSQTICEMGQIFLRFLMNFRTHIDPKDEGSTSETVAGFIFHFISFYCKSSCLSC